MPTFLEGTPTPFKIVFTTFVTTGPAALRVVFGAAVADGINASVTAIDIAIRDLLPFMGHLFYWGDLVLT
jgi:hypothetical protein